MEKVFAANRKLFLSTMADKDIRNKYNHKNGMISLYEYMTIDKNISFGIDLIDMSLFSMVDFLDKVGEYISCSPFMAEKELLEYISTYYQNYVTLVELHGKMKIILDYS